MIQPLLHPVVKDFFGVPEQLQCFNIHSLWIPDSGPGHTIRTPCLRHTKQLVTGYADQVLWGTVWNA